MVFLIALLDSSGETRNVKILGRGGGQETRSMGTGLAIAGFEGTEEALTKPLKAENLTCATCRQSIQQRRLWKLNSHPTVTNGCCFSHSVYNAVPLWKRKLVCMNIFKCMKLVMLYKKYWNKALSHRGKLTRKNKMNWACRCIEDVKGRQRPSSFCGCWLMILERCERLEMDVPFEELQCATGCGAVHSAQRSSSSPDICFCQDYSNFVRTSGSTESLCIW